MVVPPEGIVGSVSGAEVRPAQPAIRETLSMPPINMPAVRRITVCAYDTALLLNRHPAPLGVFLASNKAIFTPSSVWAYWMRGSMAGLFYAIRRNAVAPFAVAALEQG